MTSLDVIDHPSADPKGGAYEHLVDWCTGGLPHPSAVEPRQRAEPEPPSHQERAAPQPETLSDESVRGLRERYAAGEPGTALAAEFGIPTSQAYRLIHGETRRAAGGPIITARLRNGAGRRLHQIQNNGSAEVLHG